MLVYVLIIFSGLLLVHVLTHYTRKGRLVDKIPGPTPLPLIGNLLMFNLSPEKIWSIYHKLSDTFYPIGRIWLGFYPLVITRDPDDIKIMLSSKSHITKGRMYKHFEVYVGTGLITSSGKKWHHRRKLVGSIFHNSFFKFYNEITNVYCKNMIDFLKSQDNETTQNLKSLTDELSLNIICVQPASESMLNVRLSNIRTEEVEEFRESVEESNKLVVYRTIRPYLTNWIAKFMKIGRKQERNLKSIHQFINKVIQERKEYFERTGYKSFNIIDDNINMIDSECKQNGEDKRLVLLDVLLSAQNDGIIDKQGVREEIITMALAGYDTVSTTLCSIFMLLAENKKEQDLARSEAVRILDEAGGNITSVEIKKMTYINRCIKETLRILPSVPNLVRYTDQEIQLKNYTIPVGLDLACGIFNVHRDPKFWPDPEKFDPDRFLPENIKDQHPFAYIPFSAGPRNCIGQKFAIMELVTIVSHVLYNFYLEPVMKIADLKFELGIALTSTQPTRVKFIRINKN